MANCQQPLTSGRGKYRQTAGKEQHMKYGELTFGQTEALLNKVGGMDGLKKVLSGEWIVGEPAKVLKRAATVSKKVLAGLLELVGEPTWVPTIDRFVARDKFVVNRDGELPISYLGDNFTNNFLGLVEENVKTTKLKQRKLLKGSVDGPILSALGGESKAKVALAHVFEFLQTADRNLWYIFYVADVNGVVWAVGAGWDDRGWRVGAIAVADPRRWDADDRVVSR
ncbi:hypothetical protein BH11PAT2_BH11PAT2_09160 [soil metagenome]